MFYKFPRACKSAVGFNFVQNLILNSLLGLTRGARLPFASALVRLVPWGQGYGTFYILVWFDTRRIFRAPCTSHGPG